MTTMFDADHIVPEGLLSANGRVVCAYSGGMDSHVLLHLLHQHSSKNARRPLALHVNHQLNPAAPIWAEHCRDVCAQLGIEFVLIEVDARAPKGESQEAWARKLRYAALQRHVGPDDILMTAHHRDDMAETLLIQLLRGAGPAGLASMPPLTTFGAGRHYRPLLDCSREDLLAYARLHRLSWIEDDSNTDTRFDRNLLRQSIMPLLKQRWPSLSKTLYRAARLQAGAADLLDELAQIDLTVCSVDEGNALEISRLQSLSRARMINVLRYWIRSQGINVPNEQLTEQIVTDVIEAGPEASPCMNWAGMDLRRYRNHLYLMPPLPPPPPSSLRIRWNLDADCPLVLGQLEVRAGIGEGVGQAACSNGVEVRFQPSNARILTAGHHHELRKVYQQQGVPSWLRAHVPLLYVDDQLVAIPGMVIADGWKALPGEAGWKISWTGWSLSGSH